MGTTVLCFGNLQLDVLCRTLTSLPPPGELRMIDCIDFTLSGNGGNVAAALGRLGIEVELAGYSGADPIGEQFRTTLESMGVGTEKLPRQDFGNHSFSIGSSPCFTYLLTPQIPPLTAKLTAKGVGVPPKK